ncbi:unnamed protein product [Prorocentrum cordatum]|uniref:RNA helicase n=1 Tax=Prorocentrum cordatum TaxID=2364126 RepID=A0ABN9TH34_9DINO|nr:unnamed protein product [Polarella glacialis]
MSVAASVGSGQLEHDVIPCDLEARATWPWRGTVPALISESSCVVVVSPLISLMRDQCIKINYTVGQGKRRVATFLGSAQVDREEESRVLRGEYQLVYVSPEKMMSEGFLVGLREMAARGALS